MVSDYSGKFIFMGKIRAALISNREDAKVEKGIKEVPFPMVFSMVIMSLLCIILSLLAFPGIRDAILTPATDILTDPAKYKDLVIGI